MTPRRNKPKTKNWIIRMKCVVEKKIYCSNCTEEQARNSPWEYSDGDEREIYMSDWEILSIEENK